MPAASSPATPRFEGTDRYVATEDLKLAVNAALTLQRPLLIKGEPGTGKTMLAEEVARALGRPLLQWHIKSTTKAHQGLYEYDAVSRLRDSQLGDEKVRDIRNYIVQGVLWQAFEAPDPVVLLIDEIDKADIEFPNDLLRELDRMEFHVYETRRDHRGAPPSAGHHHLQQREGPAGRLPAPLLLPLHPLSGPRHHARHRGRAFPGAEAGRAARRAGYLLRLARCARTEEKAVHIGTAGLAAPAAGRRHSGRDRSRRTCRQPPCPDGRRAARRTSRIMHLLERLAAMTRTGQRR